MLVRIRAAAMNYNCLWARAGLPGMDFIFPHINGTDGAGVVEAVEDIRERDDADARDELHRDAECKEEVDEDVARLHRKRPTNLTKIKLPVHTESAATTGTLK